MIAIVTHAGAGSSRALDDLCRQAAEAGMAVLRKGGHAMEASVAATINASVQGTCLGR